MKGECVKTNRKIANAKYLFLDLLHVITHFVLSVVAFYEKDRPRAYNVLTFRRVRVTIIAAEKQ
jgi:hypothetical protein